MAAAVERAESALLEIEKNLRTPGPALPREQTLQRITLTAGRS